MFWNKNKRGSKPDGFVDVNYGYGVYESRDYQDTWNWPWAPNPARETLRAVSNCWTGNQLPGYTNFIPAVAQSKILWNQPTAYMNLPAGHGYSFKIGNIQYNTGYNIGSMSQWSTAQLQQQVQKAWSSRTQVQA